MGQIHSAGFFNAASGADPLDNAASPKRVERGSANGQIVSVGFVADMDVRGDLIVQIDRCNRDWAENLTQKGVASRPIA